jgi:hypothetical protein
MKIIESQINLEELNEMARNKFGNMVKAVVDIEKKIMAVDGDLHADEEALLLNNGSNNKNLWGINLYPELNNEDWIEFDSMINLRPAHNNRTRGVDDQAIQQQIVVVVDKLVKR